MSYLLDANVFIQAKQLYYGMDFCPAFWDWLIQQNAQGTVHSIEKVGDELTAGNDALSQWAGEHDATFFLPPDEKVLQALTTVSNWVKSDSPVRTPFCRWGRACGGGRDMGVRAAGCVDLWHFGLMGGGVGGSCSPRGLWGAADRRETPSTRPKPVFFARSGSTG